MPSPCQISFGAMKAKAYCPNNELRNLILVPGAKRINIVYVFYVVEDAAQDIFENVYKNRRTAIRNALESNNCPNRAIDNAGLTPVVKLPGFGC